MIAFFKTPLSSFMSSRNQKAIEEKRDAYQKRLDIKKTEGKCILYQQKAVIVRKKKSQKSRRELGEIVIKVKPKFYKTMKHFNDKIKEKALVTQGGIKEAADYYMGLWTDPNNVE